MESKHTPGPWAVGFSDGTGPTYITAGDHPALKKTEESIVVVVSGATDDWGVEHGVRNPADAQLIAAAPDMLALLRELVDLEGPQPGNVAWARKVQAVVAKATGES